MSSFEHIKSGFETRNPIFEDEEELKKVLTSLNSWDPGSLIAQALLSFREKNLDTSIELLDIEWQELTESKLAGLTKETILATPPRYIKILEKLQLINQSLSTLALEITDSVENFS